MNRLTKTKESSTRKKIDMWLNNLNDGTFVNECIPRNPNKEPKVCPNSKCKSPYWNRPRQNENGRGGTNGKRN